MPGSGHRGGVARCFAQVRRPFVAAATLAGAVARSVSRRPPAPPPPRQPRDLRLHGRKSVRSSFPPASPSSRWKGSAPRWEWWPVHAGDCRHRARAARCPRDCHPRGDAAARRSRSSSAVRAMTAPGLVRECVIGPAGRCGQLGGGAFGADPGCLAGGGGGGGGATTILHGATPIFFAAGRGGGGGSGLPTRSLPRSTAPIAATVVPLTPPTPMPLAQVVAVAPGPRVPAVPRAPAVPAARAACDSAAPAFCSAGEPEASAAGPEIVSSATASTGPTGRRRLAHRGEGGAGGEHDGAIGAGGGGGGGGPSVAAVAAVAASTNARRQLGRWGWRGRRRPRRTVVDGVRTRDGSLRLTFVASVTPVPVPVPAARPSRSRRASPADRSRTRIDRYAALEPRQPRRSSRR